MSARQDGVVGERGGSANRRGELARLLAASLAVLIALIAAAPAPAHVLRVGRWRGVDGQYRSIQSAVSAARPGDWILVGPGDYHEQPGRQWGVLITKPRIHLRGMDRNRVVVDGTKRSAPRTCDGRRRYQDLGPREAGKRMGRNGVEPYKVSGVSVENLTVCNFLSQAGTEQNGNEIWFNGGDGSGKIGMRSFRGRYLTATSTFFGGQDAPMALYGIFSSNERGPGLIAHSYGSNMGDSAYYIGACGDCNVVLTDGHGYNSAQGMTFSDAGGRVTIEHTEFAWNKMGLIPNSLNNDDGPWNQDGACPQGTKGPRGTSSCSIIEHNFVHDNNNPNVPAIGIAASAPLGTGIELSGAQHDTIYANRVWHQGAWGILVHFFPDQRTDVPSYDHCQGGYPSAGGVCYFPAFGNEIANNELYGNGFFGNPSNGDLAEATEYHDPGNCWHGNHRLPGMGEPSSDPPNIQQTQGTCGQPGVGDQGVLLAQIACDSQFFGPCPSAAAGAYYPRTTKVSLWRLPRHEATMPHPCRGVPADPWCPRRSARDRDRDRTG
ncbi:MAG: right-handed parallel beta-helix repeat-containing protein [Actinobacteria bacterium]|nr:right-handed parallel beta-helix repeat-containing protein [Actinomycetota bacterium]